VTANNITISNKEDLGMLHITSQRRPSHQIIIVVLTIVLGTGAVRAAITRRWSDGGNFTRSSLRTMEYRDTDKHSVSTRSWDDAASQSSSPEEISKAVMSRIEYSSDRFKEDEWRSGKDTWARGAGDCEDYAAAVKELCAEKGYEADLFVVRSKDVGEAHAITMGKRNGRIWVSSNGSYSEHQSIFDAKQELVRDLGWYAPDTEMVKVNQPETDSDRSYMQLTSTLTN
jgi:predicted transglutaminase-like cysteine proteinase